MSVRTGIERKQDDERKARTKQKTERLRREYARTHADPDPMNRLIEYLRAKKCIRGSGAKRKHSALEYIYERYGEDVFIEPQQLKRMLEELVRKGWVTVNRIEGSSRNGFMLIEYRWDPASSPRRLSGPIGTCKDQRHNP